MSIKLRKIGIIGAGHVGSHVALSLATQGQVDELYIADMDKDKTISQAEDIKDSTSYLPHQVRAYAVPVEDLGDCDIIVNASGLLPVKGQDRLDMLAGTINICKDIIPRLKKSGFSGIIISISNPADVIAAYLQKHLDYPKHKIISSGTALDSARLQMLLSQKYNISPKSLQAYAMGEHGFSSMIPFSRIMIGGKSLYQLQEDMPDRFPPLDEEALNEAVKHQGYVVLNGKGSTEFGIATATVELIRAILHDEKKILPCSVALDGHYGEDHVYASTPVILGKDGVEAIIELPMTDKEQELFHKSCELIRSYMAKAEEI